MCRIQDIYNINTEVTDHSTCVQHYAVKFILGSCAFMHSVFSLFPLYQGRQRSSERCSNLPKVTQPGTSGTSRCNSAIVCKSSESPYTSIPNQGHFWPPEDIWQYLEMVLTVMLGCMGASDIWWVERPEMLLNILQYTDRPALEELTQPQKSGVPRMRTLDPVRWFFLLQRPL